ncbi:hypothetical protein ACP70R_048733 [Stipagrostis hirtigluma subsp. patula]
MKLWKPGGNSSAGQNQTSEHYDFDGESIQFWPGVLYVCQL